jgi:hypothetical protein
MIFWLVLKLEISYIIRVYDLFLKEFGFLLEDFFLGED